VTTLNKVLIKLGNENTALNTLAQISSKGANSCAISPFDSSQLEIIEKSLKVWDDSL
jgi:ribosome recycling factor